MYKPLGITHGNETLIAIREALIKGPYGDFWLPTCWFGLFYVGFVVITFFVFKKHREFPNFMLGMINVFDLLHFLREVIKGGPGTISEYTIWKVSNDVCALLYLWVTWIEAAQFVVGVYLALLIYRTVVKKEDLAYYRSNNSLCKTLFIIFWLYTSIYITIIGAVAQNTGYKP